MANIGSPQDAALVARTAVTGAQDATPVVRTLFLERLAWASAKAGEHEATRRTLDEVNETYERRGPDEPEWVYWLDRKEIDVMAGRCLIELGAPPTPSLSCRPPSPATPAEHAREIALYLSWLAESHARAGDADAAWESLRHARSYVDTMPLERANSPLAAVERLLRS